MHYKEEEMNKLPNGRMICPACKKHVQVTEEEFDELPFETQRELDCKNTYGKTEYAPGEFCCKGQCQCYSKSHIMSEDE